MDNIIENQPKPRNQDKIVRSSLIATLDRIFEAYTHKADGSQLTVLQHLQAILRSKGETDINPKNPKAKTIDPFEWDNERFLSKAEKYYSELEECPPGTWGTDLDLFDYKRKR